VLHGIHEITLRVQSDRVCVDYLVINKRDPHLRVSRAHEAEVLIADQRLSIDDQPIELTFVEAAPQGQDQVLYKFASAAGALGPGEHRIHYAALNSDHAQQILIRVRAEQGATIVPQSMKIPRENERAFLVEAAAPQQ